MFGQLGRHDSEAGQAPHQLPSLMCGTDNTWPRACRRSQQLNHNCSWSTCWSNQTPSVLGTILKANAEDGRFYELRSHDGRQPDDSQQVVWLPGRSFAEAQVIQRASKIDTSLVRQGDRYGLRTDHTQAEELCIALTWCTSLVPTSKAEPGSCLSEMELVCPASRTHWTGRRSLSGVYSQHPNPPTGSSKWPTCLQKIGQWLLW